jgi:hypothetical protein
MEFQHCKIHVVEGIAFSSAGLVGSDDGVYSVERIVADVLREKGSLAISAERIANRTQAPLLRYISVAHDNMPPADYAAFSGSMDSVLTVGFAGMFNNAPAFATIDFMQIKDAKGNPIGMNPVIRKCPGDLCTRAGRGYTIIGFKNAAKEEIAKSRFFTAKCYRRRSAYR